MLSSIFELYNFAIGPSSSHTVGPMRAAKHFLTTAFGKIDCTEVAQIKVRLFGSLAYTGEGHGTVQAIIVGLMGYLPEDVEPQEFQDYFHQVSQEKIINLDHKVSIPFLLTDITKHYEAVELYHPNTLAFFLYRADGSLLFTEEYYSVGGGAIENRSKFDQNQVIIPQTQLPYNYSNMEELFNLCREYNRKPFEIVLANEITRFSSDYVMGRLEKIYQTMLHTIDRGLSIFGKLPGPLKIERRAGNILKELRSFKHSSIEGIAQTNYLIQGHVSAWALSVIEENAAFGKIVTAPTCGSCGIIPAVLKFYEVFCCGNQSAPREKIVEFLLTAGAIGLLFKHNASISGAEVGCQGEVGVACSMAAGALAAVLGGSLEQIEGAARAGIVHFLGLTCDPIAGLVQVPCIERNAVAANTAIEAANLALVEPASIDGISLDQAIKVMKETGLDMNNRYKETSLGGLAIVKQGMQYEESSSVLVGNG